VTLNPKVQGSTPCASTIMLYQGVSQRLPVVPDVSIETCARPSESWRVPLLTPRKLRSGPDYTRLQPILNSSPLLRWSGQALQMVGNPLL
jgi:hypothetical protein